MAQHDGYTDMDKFSKMRHIFGKMLQIMVSLKNDHLNIVTEPCSSRKDQILTIWHFHATTPNNDLSINNNMTKKK